ncbi:hypothetical protein B0T24DRAFT_602473 [Lasiosphaeria ovina]|uniref:Uncharacterized protein n=1 Tax=Lasiosphaeria ovina TaxID=92902 RepID=A0AAE0TX65_9PEZI|nr:hypothetical protein B0T24DRAFT_602473 [Lasiosphaeria ovina]
MSVQCIYCQQVRAKNTTRQKQHLAQCATYLQAHPDVVIGGPSHPHPGGIGGITDAAADGYADSPSLDGSADPTTALSGYPAPTPTRVPGVNVNVNVNGTPNTQPLRHSLSTPADGTPSAKRQKVAKANTSNLPEIPLRDVHAAFVEFRVKDDDKCVSARCIYCNQVRAKNTSRQRDHLLSCPGYQSVLKEKIPANNLRHQFDEDDVASSLALPSPTLDLDFRLSIRVKPKINVGTGNFGLQSWISCIGGQWAGRWGKGTVLPGGQDMQTTVKDMSTHISARYLIQTQDDKPAVITCNIKGWWLGEKDIMERLQDPVAADNITAQRYKFRVTMELETGDPRYAEINTGIWVGSGCRRGAEIVYDAYRVN